MEFDSLVRRDAPYDLSGWAWAGEIRWAGLLAI